MRTCLLDKTTKKVVNVIEIEEDSNYELPQNCEFAPDPGGEVGWIWNGEGWDKPPEPEMPLEELIFVMRLKRDSLLSRYVDTINAVRWSTFSEEEKQSWILYRNALLDVPQQEGFPYEINWPQLPG